MFAVHWIWLILTLMFLGTLTAIVVGAVLLVIRASSTGHKPSAPPPTG